MLIYDPLLEKAFVKDFVVNLNLREDIFPEFPSKVKEPVQRIANVWKNWIEDSQEDMFKSFQVDQEGMEHYLIHKYIRCPIDAGNCINTLISNFDVIKTFQKHCQFGST